jgi:hypothetical protein
LQLAFVYHALLPQTSCAGIMYLYCSLLLQTGCADIVLGREDGSLEVWDVDRQGQPQLVVAMQLSESITSVDGGYITSPASPDVIVHTFTGKVSILSADA